MRLKLNRYNMNETNPGYLVLTKKGKKGRTYHSKGFVKNKIPVYLETSKHVYSDKAILCDPATVTQIGFID